MLLDHLLDSPEKHRRAALWQAHLEQMLALAGGVTGSAEEEAAQRKLGRS